MHHLFVAFLWKHAHIDVVVKEFSIEKSKKDLFVQLNNIYFECGKTETENEKRADQKVYIYLFII